MGLGFVSGKKAGMHYDLATFAAKKLRSANILLKGQTERRYEHTIIAHLQSSPKIRKNLLTQIGDDEVDKITDAYLFGFKHRPDTTIGKDGTAIEIKVIKSGHAVRDILGQGVVYRMNYRFVILVFVDNTPGKKLVELCCDKKSKEYSLLQGLADSYNIFSVVGPYKQSKNLIFVS